MSGTVSLSNPQIDNDEEEACLLLNVNPKDFS